MENSDNQLPIYPLENNKNNNFNKNFVKTAFTLSSKEEVEERKRQEIKTIKYPDFDIQIISIDGIAFVRKFSKDGKPLPIILEEMKRLQSKEFQFVEAEAINGGFKKYVNVFEL